MTWAQLTIDAGVEMPVDRLAPRVGRIANSVLALASRQGGLITSSQAGRLVHTARNARMGHTGCNDPFIPGAVGCCREAASDGGRVLRQLERERVVERVGVGLYAVLEPRERGVA